MLLLLLASLLALGAEAQTYKKAVDTTQALSQNQFACLKNAGYTVAFVRTFKADGNGTFDQNVVANVKAAAAAGISTELFIEPQPNSRWGYDQADEINKELKKNGVHVKNPSMWPTDQIANCGFINEILMRSRQNGYSVGLYTNANDWNTITGNWQWAGSDILLWYWNVSGAGSSGESPANFNDFQPFDSFTTPKVKQYGQNELICSLFFNV